LEKGIAFHNTLSLETGKLYPKESSTGLHDLEIFRRTPHIGFDEEPWTASAFKSIRSSSRASEKGGAVCLR